MKDTIIDKGLTGLASAGVIAAALAAGIAMQRESFAFVIMALAFAGLWILWLLIKGISLPRNLIVVSTLFIMPAEYAFNYALMMLILVLIADMYQSKQRQLLIPYPISFLILTVFGMIALSKTYVEGGRTYFVASIIVPLLCFVTIANSRKSKPALDLWMRMIGIVATLVALIGIYVAVTNPTKRIGSTWSNAMTINGFYALAFFFCIALAFKSPQVINRIFWALASVIIFLGMLFTYTRMAMLAIVFGLGLMILKYRRIRIWGLIAIGLIPLVIPSSMMSRGVMVDLIDISILIRLIAWYKASFVIAANPLTGIGFSTWKDIYHDMIPISTFYAQHTHNVYINLLVEIGVIGTLAYFIIIARSLRTFYVKAVKPANDMAAFCVLVGMLSLLFACLTDIFIQQYSVSTLFWITLALMYKEAEPEPSPRLLVESDIV